MIVKGIGATTEVDRHNCQITKEALESSMRNITEGEYAPSVGLNHDHSVMPIGKVIKGELVPFKENEYAAQIHQDIFFDDFVKCIDNNGEAYYVGESKYDTRPFADTEKETVTKLQIGVDPVNFENNEFQEVADFFEKECNADSQPIMRKSLIPDPEIVFTLITGTLLFWTGKKTLDKLSDSIACDIAGCYSLIKKAIAKVVSFAIPKNRPITYVFRESDSYVTELIIQTTDLNQVLEATKPENLSSVFDKIDQVSALISDSIAKIQFTYDCQNNKWEFNYLTSVTGQVLGTEKCYKRTAKVFEEIIKQSNAQASLAGTTNEQGDSKSCQNNPQQ